MSGGSRHQSDKNNYMNSHCARLIKQILRCCSSLVFVYEGKAVENYLLFFQSSCFRNVRRLPAVSISPLKKGMGGWVGGGEFCLTLVLIMAQLVQTFDPILTQRKAQSWQIPDAADRFRYRGDMEHSHLEFLPWFRAFSSSHVNIIHVSVWGGNPLTSPDLYLSYFGIVFLCATLQQPSKSNFSFFMLTHKR